MADRPARRPRALLAVPIAVAAAACASIPNVRPFAAGTADLYRASGTETRAIVAQYDASIALADELLAGRGPRLADEEREIIAGTRERLTEGRRSFRSSSRAFDAVLRQAVSYSERLAELAAAGESGGEAAQSLASTINGFSTLAGGAGAIVTGPAAEILQRVGDHVTRVQARRSLREAAAEAHGAVEIVAAALTEIHGGEDTGAVQQLVSSLASDHDQLLLYQAGAGIVGYYREAGSRRQEFYRRALLTLQLNADGISGFCRDPETGAIDPECISGQELTALREVEALLAILAPEVEAYEAARAELRAWRAARRANGALIARAVGAWVGEHRGVIDALQDGSGVSAFSLRAILAEIETIR